MTVAVLQCIDELKSELDFLREKIERNEWKDEGLCKALSDNIDTTREKLKYEVGLSVHRVIASQDFEPSKKVMREIVAKFPSVLETQSDDAWMYYPIEACAGSENSSVFQYIPIFAEAALKTNVFQVETEEFGFQRGGLLMYDANSVWESHNTLQWLVCYDCFRQEDVENKLNVIKELRSMKLLKKDDIRNYNLLFWASFDQYPYLETLNYFAQWDAEALRAETFKYGGVRDLPLIHKLIETKVMDHAKATTLQNFFTLSLQYFPQECGLLFQKDNNGKTAFHRAVAKIGMEGTMDILHKIFSTNEKFPILHHAFRHIGSDLEGIDAFMKKFPWAYQLRDEDGRSLHQAVFAYGGKLLKTNNMLLATLTDDQIREKDPVTTLHPFAAVASGEDGDLEKSFYLLRRQPGVLERGTNTLNKKKRKRSKSSK